VRAVPPARDGSTLTNGRAEMTEPYLHRVDCMAQIPAGRVGAEEDIGGLILFLASRAGAYVNGASFVMDGGWLDWSVGSSRL
jgi:2-deoxy-D-gluconate 3-dehydrogenase